jgi:Fe-S cluster assembly iron-binding protein IscA
MIITDAAKNQFNEIRGIIRYSLNGGGCSGLIGKWEGNSKINEEVDIIVWKSENDDDTMFVIDSFTIEHLNKATIDFTGGPFAPAFKVSMTDKKSCGCGESFVL